MLTVKVNSITKDTIGKGNQLISWSLLARSKRGVMLHITLAKTSHVLKVENHSLVCLLFLSARSQRVVSIVVCNKDELFIEFIRAVPKIEICFSLFHCKVRILVELKNIILE